VGVVIADAVRHPDRIDAAPVSLVVTASTGGDMTHRDARSPPMARPVRLGAGFGWNRRPQGGRAVPSEPHGNRGHPRDRRPAASRIRPGGQPR